MIHLIEVFIILFVHGIGDFLLQTDWQAKNKCKNNGALTMHVASYSLCWVLPMTIMFSFYFYRLDAFLLACFFSIITFICHWVTDYFTSRLNRRLLAKEQHHNFFVSIYADQLLHFAQLLLLYYFIKSI